MSKSKIEKISGVVCEKCGSYQVLITKDGPECDECSRIIGYTIKKPKLKERCHRVFGVKEKETK